MFGVDRTKEGKKLFLDGTTDQPACFFHMAGNIGVDGETKPFQDVIIPLIESGGQDFSIDREEL